MGCTLIKHMWGCVHLHSPRSVLQLLVHSSLLIQWFNRAEKVSLQFLQGSPPCIGCSWAACNLQIHSERLAEMKLLHTSAGDGAAHGFVPREPAEEKAALLRGTVALVTHAVPVDTLSLLLSSANRTSAPTAARLGTSLSHPLCHMPDCQSHSQILIMSARHFFRRASPTAGCLLQIS